MSGLRQFAFKQYWKVHVFCLMMMVIFRMFMSVQMGLLLWVALILSVLGSGCYTFTKPHELSKDIYTLMAVTSCVSLSIVAQRFLWIALRIDFRNLFFFLVSMLVFAGIVIVRMRIKEHERKRKRLTVREKIIKFRYAGWYFLLFLFFYQLILGYLLRPNFLTVLALSVAHANLLLSIWTYFDIRKLYARKQNRHI
ncbi:MAG: hypothetical protein FWE07_08265 [Turicibacter sp.]|nr:hypothetical protein [Turicibacter sp.]